MSHFTVMVFGDNPEELLAPYDENMKVEEYATDVDENSIERFQKYYIEKHPEEKDLSVKELYKLHGEDWNDGRWCFEENGVVELSTYNPDCKWDYYRLGGRWKGYFKLKEGANGEKGSVGLGAVIAPKDRADALRKSDIDIEGMRNEAAEEASKVYDKAQEIINEFGKEYTSWKDIVDSEGDDMDAKRIKYHNQPIAKAFREHSDIFGFMSNIEDFFIPREEYLQNARNSAITPFAFITPEGEWIEKGKMGWWAMVSDEKNPEDWNKQFSDYFDSLPDDTMISLVDCHI